LTVKLEIGTIFLGPYDSVYVLLSKSKGSVWSVWCSKLNNANGNAGIIKNWRNEKEIADLIKNDIIALVG
jgi:hypothetical protein